MLDVFSTYFAVACVLRFQSCNLHCYVSSHFFDCIVNNICLNVYKNADLSTHMCVRSNESVFFFHLSKSSDVHVLTDNCDLSCKSFVYSLGCVKCPWLCKESINICCGSCKCLCCNFCNIVLEFFVLSNEVCLRVNFYNNCVLFVISNESLAKTFCCNTACFLLSCSKTFFTQEFYCFVHIAFCSCKSFLTIHHSGTGHFS